MEFKHAKIRSKQAEPKELEVGLTKMDPPCQEGHRNNVELEIANSNWNDSFVWHDIMPDKKLDWKVFAHTWYFYSMPKESFLDVQTAIQNGIDVPVERIKLKVDCLKECDGLCGECTDGKIYAILVPLTEPNGIKTKEGIRTECLRVLNKHFMNTIRLIHLEDEQVRLVLNAMEELHNQPSDAVEFTEWISDNGWRKKVHTHPNKVGQYYCDEFGYKTIQKLYEQFKLTKNK